MAQYIDKSALVAEMERRRDAALTRQKNLESIGQETVLNEMVANELNKILSFIDTLEVKEVDINEEAKRKWDSFSLCYDESRGCDVVVWPYWVYKQVCKYFFKLGLAQKGE